MQSKCLWLHGSGATGFLMREPDVGEMEKAPRVRDNSAHLRSHSLTAASSIPARAVVSARQSARARLFRWA